MCKVQFDFKYSNVVYKPCDAFRRHERLLGFLRNPHLVGSR